MSLPSMQTGYALVIIFVAPKWSGNPRIQWGNQQIERHVTSCFSVFPFNFIKNGFPGFGEDWATFWENRLVLALIITMILCWNQQILQMTRNNRVMNCMRFHFCRGIIGFSRIVDVLSHWKVPYSPTQFIKVPSCDQEYLELIVEKVVCARNYQFWAITFS